MGEGRMQIAEQLVAKCYRVDDVIEFVDLS